jgi:hypothetical protein
MTWSQLTDSMTLSIELLGTAWHIVQMVNGLQEVGYFFPTPRTCSEQWSVLGAADPATHKIYIWDLSNDGQFATTLDGGREPLVHIQVSRVNHHRMILMKAYSVAPF